MTNMPEHFFAPESSLGMTLDGCDYTLTTEHAASSYGVPVLIDVASGNAYGPADTLPSGKRAADAVRAQGQYGVLELVPRYLATVGLQPIATVDGRQ